MSRFWICLSAVLLLAVCIDAQEEPNPQSLTLKDLRERPIIGELGVPLGTVAEIEAIVVAGRELRRKYDSSAYLLKVTHVNGKQLAQPPVIRFGSFSFHSVDLANDSFVLHKLKTGVNAKSLHHDEIEQLEQGYVGKSFRLTVFEEGAFRGMPSDLPDDVLSWQDLGCGFHSSLVVLANRDKLPEEE